MESILANITFTDVTKKTPISNVLTLNLDLEEAPVSAGAPTSTPTSNTSSIEN
jgi:hypothetical protein